MRGTVAAVVEGVDEGRGELMTGGWQGVAAIVRAAMFQVSHDLCCCDNVMCVVVCVGGDLLCDVLNGVSRMVIYLNIFDGVIVMSSSSGNFVDNAEKLFGACVNFVETGAPVGVGVSRCECGCNAEFECLVEVFVLEVRADLGKQGVPGV